MSINFKSEMTSRFRLIRSKKLKQIFVILELTDCKSVDKDFRYQIFRKNRNLVDLIGIKFMSSWN